MCVYNLLTTEYITILVIYERVAIERTDRDSKREFDAPLIPSSC